MDLTAHLEAALTLFYDWAPTKPVTFYYSIRLYL